MDLVDPFHYHVYIGGQFSISWFMQDCYTLLDRIGYKVCLKYNLCVDDIVLHNMKYYIDESYRCVLLLTDNYEQDLFARDEKERLKKKCDKFTNEAVLVINLADKINYEREFKEIKVLDKTNFDECLYFVVDEIKKILISKDLELLMVPKEGIGLGAAFSYFYGYLRLILPDMKKNFYEITLQKNKDLIKHAVPKYLIIVPENCKGRISFNVEEKIRTTDKYVVKAAKRAGIKWRDYKTSVHEITKRGECEKDVTQFYFAGEFSTPTLTMYESYCFGKCGFTLEQLNQERNLFVLALEALLNDCHETKDSFRILYWRNINDDGDDALYAFLLKAVLEEIQNKKTDEKMANVKEITRSVSNDSFNNNMEMFFEIQNVSVANPKVIYDEETYPLNLPEVKGLCLILIYSECLKGRKREGFTKDKENLEEIFKRLQFDIEIHEDYSTEKLKDFMESLKERKWDRYGCVACCISSHGSDGNIHTTDSMLSIYEITEYLYDSKCPKLKGKPKLFFIQCCLEGWRIMSLQIYFIKSNSLIESRKQLPASLVPRNPDFIISYCCLPGELAMRSTSKGSIYFQALFEVLHPGIEIKDCLYKTNELTNSMLQKHRNKHQKPFYVNSLDKPMYL